MSHIIGRGIVALTLCLSTAALSQDSIKSIGPLSAGNVTAVVNLTGPITSIGNATAIASQTGTGSKFVVDTSPTLITPILGLAAASSLNITAAGCPANGLNLSAANTLGLCTNGAGVLSLNSVTATSSAQAGQVSIGTTTPTAGASFTVSANSTAPTLGAFPASGNIGHFVGADGISPRVLVDSFANPPLINFRRADGTNASASGLIAADIIGGIQWSGFAGASTSAYVVQKATFDVIAEATWSNTDTSTSFRWFTTIAASTTQTQKMRLWSDGGLAVGATAVATDPGTGGVLIDGTFKTASTTDATTTTSGALQIAGGAAIRKRVFIDGITASAGLQTAVLCQSSGGEMIADSVACLASAAKFKNVRGLMPDGALDKIMRLPIDLWSYKSEGQFTSDDWTRERIGPLADDVAAMDPRLAGYDSDGNVRTYSTEQLLAFTIKALQEANARIDRLERR